MIRINWEEIFLVVLFAAMTGSMLEKEKWWAAASCAVWTGFLLFAASRRPQATTGERQ